jgi:hypothetical protein
MGRGLLRISPLTVFTDPDSSSIISFLGKISQGLKATFQLSNPEHHHYEPRNKAEGLVGEGDIAGTNLDHEGQL